MPRIINFGSLNLDYVYTVPHILKPGETLASLSRTIFAGGKGLNQTVAAARAGAQVWHGGALGSDDHAVIDAILSEDQIHTEFLKQHPGPSGHTIIQVDAGGQNCILLFGGANQSLQRADIDAALDHFAPGDFLILQNETNELAYLIEAGSKRQLKVCLNASPLDDKLKDLPLDLCAYLLVNEIEGRGLIQADEEIADDKLALKLHQTFSASTIVLTLGTKGSILISPDGSMIEVPIFKVKAVDTTAAGDTYSGYLIAAVAAGQSLEQAARLAAAASALAVTKPGACPSIPRLNEVQAFLAQQA